MNKTGFFSIILLVTAIFFQGMQLCAAEFSAEGTHLLNNIGRNLGRPAALRKSNRNDTSSSPAVSHLPEKTIGTIERFFSFNFASNTWEETNARLVGIGRNILVYLEETAQPEGFAVQKLIDEFDSRIYAQTTRFFGNEKRPGVDSDDRITILLMDIKDKFAESKTYTSGYFNRGDCYRPEEIPEGTNLKSNQREMLYVDINPSEPNCPEFFATIAHELQHLIHFHHDPGEYDWVDEGCAQINTYLCGYGHPRQIAAFQKNPDNSLVSWSPWQMVANYGQTYMWNYYLMQRFLPDDASREMFFRDLVADQETGRNSFEKQLKRFNISFSEAFLDFNLANFLNRPNGFTPDKYAYGKDFADFVLPAASFIESIPNTLRNSVSIWGSDLIKVSLTAATSKLRIDFAGDLTLLKNSFDVALVFVSEKNGKALKLETIDNIKSTTRSNTEKPRVMLPDNNDGYPPPPAVKTQMGHSEVDVPNEADSLYIIITGKSPADIADSSLVWEPKANYRLDITNIGATRKRGSNLAAVNSDHVSQLYQLMTSTNADTNEKSAMVEALQSQIVADIRSRDLQQQNEAIAEHLEAISTMPEPEMLSSLRQQLQCISSFNQLQRD